MTEGAEGYVYVHPGIHRFGSLRPRLFDWRNPVVNASQSLLKKTGRKSVVDLFD